MDGEVGEVEEEGPPVIPLSVALDDLLRLGGEEVGGVVAKVAPRHAQVPPAVVAPTVLKWKLNLQKLSTTRIKVTHVNHNTTITRNKRVCYKGWQVTSKTPRIKHETRSVGTAYRAGQSLGKFGYRAGR